MRIQWTPELDKRLLELKEHGLGWNDIASAMGLTFGQVNNRYEHVLKLPPAIVPDSDYPKYNEPLVQEGDVLVLPDPEFPFHNAPFMNSVFEVASAWGIRKCNIAGDALHFDSLSGWEPNWKDKPKGGLSEDQELKLTDFLKRLPAKYQDDGFKIAIEIGGIAESNVSDETNIAAKMLEEIGRRFDDVVYVIGNHEGRLLRTINSPLYASKLLQFIGVNNPKFRIAPYYYSLIHTKSGTFRIVHPKGSGAQTAVNIAAKEHQHVLMAHSHNISMQYDISGKFYAWQIGCCVDEERLAYVGQRDNAAKKHKLGACIIRNGRPYLFDENTDWELMLRML